MIAVRKKNKKHMGGSSKHLDCLMRMWQTIR